MQASGGVEPPRRYDPDNPGEHRLWLNVGGRLGHGCLHALDVHEGRLTDAGGRRWEIEVLPATEARHETESRQDDAKEKRAKERATATLESDRREIIAVAVKLAVPETKNGLRDRVSFPHKRFPAAFTSLADDGTLEPATVSKANGQTYDGWRVRDDG